MTRNGAGVGIWNGLHNYARDGGFQEVLDVEASVWRILNNNMDKDPKVPFILTMTIYRSEGALAGSNSYKSSTSTITSTDITRPGRSIIRQC